MRSNQIKREVNSSNNIVLNVVINNKYTVRQDLGGKVYVLRYDEQWKDCVGDNFILEMAIQIKESRHE